PFAARLAVDDRQLATADHGEGALQRHSAVGERAEIAGGGVERDHCPVHFDGVVATAADHDAQQSQAHLRLPFYSESRAESPVQRCPASASPTARRMARSEPTRTTSRLPRVTAV